MRLNQFSVCAEFLLLTSVVNTLAHFRGRRESVRHRACYFKHKVIFIVGKKEGKRRKMGKSNVPLTLG